MSDNYFWRQCFILTATLLYSLCVGFMLGFPAVLNPSLLAKNGTDIQTSGAHASWIAASNGAGGLIGSFILPPILQIYGRKAAHITLNSVLFIGWIIFPFAKDIGALYAARLIQGVSVGGIYINSIIISEYVHPSRRGYFITLKKVMLAAGTLICHAMDPFWTWRQISIFAAIPAILAILMTFFWPESPSYLALNGRFSECKKSFIWLNGNSDESNQHFKSLKESQMGKSRSQKSLRELLKNFLKKDFQKSFLIVSILTLALDLCGRYYFVAYVIQIMMELLGSKTSAILFTIGADTLTLIALLLSSIVIRYFKRRTLLFSFGIITVLQMLIISLLLYFKTVYTFGTYFLWLIALIIISQCFIVNVGFIPISFAVIGEIFPLEHKGLGACTSGVVFTSLYALTLKLTPVLMDSTGLHGTYAIYGVSLSLCLVLLYKIVPETKDKTLQEIENSLKYVKEIELNKIASKRNILMENSII